MRKRASLGRAGSIALGAGLGGAAGGLVDGENRLRGAVVGAGLGALGGYAGNRIKAREVEKAQQAFSAAEADIAKANQDYQTLINSSRRSNLIDAVASPGKTRADWLNKGLNAMEREQRYQKMHLDGLEALRATRADKLKQLDKARGGSSEAAGIALGGLGAAGAGALMNDQTKLAGLCSSISGTINRSDFERFNKSFRNEKVASLVNNNEVVQGVLSDLVSEEIYSTEKMASGANAALGGVVGTDVIQVVPKGYGYVVKMAAAPVGVAPQQVEMSAQQAQAALPQQTLQQANQQGVATVTNVQAAPDPLVETPEPALKFGIYKCINAQNNREVMGFVIPQLLNPMTGQMVPMALFTNGSSYALQPSVVGVMTGINFNLPSSDVPRGLGVFYKTNGKAIVATVPFNIVSEISVQGRVYYSAKTTEGLDVQLVMSQGLQAPIMAAQNEIAIPADFKFLPLDNPIQISMGNNMLKQAQAEAYESMAVIRCWQDEGKCSLEGPVFEKMGSGEHTIADGLFYLAAAGCPQNLSMALMDKSASEKEPVRIFGLRTLYTIDEFRKEAADEAAALLSQVVVPKRQNFLAEISAVTMSKQASALVGTATVDSVLALNFINPENIGVFVEHLPQLEDSVKKLAELVLATQLGLQSVPLNAAVRAMHGLDAVIQGLKGLKSYSV